MTDEQLERVLQNLLPTRDEILEAIKKGVYESFPWPSEIIAAIEAGVRRRED